MKMIKLILSFMLFFSVVSKSQTVNLVAESKKNLCLLNHEVIQGIATATPSSLGFYKTFSTQKVSPGFYSSAVYPSAVFVDNYHKRLLIGANINAFNTPQYNTFYSPFYSTFYGFGNSAVADLNNNNTPDAVSSNSRGDVYLHRNVGSLAHVTDSISATNALPPSAKNARVYLTKIDNDPLPDLVSIGTATAVPFGYYYSVYKNNSTSSVLAFAQMFSGYTTTLTTPPNDNFSACSYDLNNDGKDELLFVSEATTNSLTIIYSLAGNLNMKMPPIGISAPNLLNKKVTAGDFNKDGQKDIAVLGTVASTSLSYVYFYSPTFASGIPTGITQQTFVTIPYIVDDFVFADMNRDSLKDMVVNVANTGSVLVYMQNKVGLASDFITPPAVFNQGLHLSAGLASFDVDDNKITDIISFNTGGLGNMIDTSSISILKNFTFRDTLFAIPSKTLLCPGESVVLKNDLKNYSGVGYYSPFSPSISLQAFGHTLTVNTASVYWSSATYSTLLTFPTSASSCIVNSNSVLIVSGTSPSISFSGPKNICSGQTASITAIGAGSYTWSTGAINVPFILLSPTVSSVVYSVVGRSSSGCIGYAMDSLKVYPDFSPNVGFDKNFLCRNDKAKLTASGGQTYTWSTGQIMPSITITQTSTTSQDYTVLVDDGNGCIKIATVQTTFNDKCNEVVIKNAVTPNGDGDNDFFYIENIDHYPENQIYIFNRWGQELYYKKGYNNDDKDKWPAENANKLSAGTYYYVIDLGNGDPLRKGWIEILSN